MYFAIRVTSFGNTNSSDIIHLEQVYAGDDGYAVFEYIHDIQNAGTGTMTVTAYHNSTIDTATYKVVDANVINSLVSTIQTECKKESPDYVIVKNAYLGEDSDANGIADNAEIFNLNLTLYNTLPNQDNVFKILADDPENDSVDSMEKAVQAFYDAVAIETIINGSSTSVITDLMSNDLYSPIFKKDKLPVDSEGKCVLDVVSGTVQTKVYEQILYSRV